MIFLTIGTQLPFERLVQAIDEVAEKIDEKIFGQIGSSTYLPRNFEAVDYLDAMTFNDKFSSARLIVGHAGVGTAISARKFGKPLALMPRRHAYGEHRNDHQVATAEQFRNISGIEVFNTKEELLDLCTRKNLTSVSRDNSQSLQMLIRNLSLELFKVSKLKNN